jgi:hypothetical protein
MWTANRNGKRPGLPKLIEAHHDSMCHRVTGFNVALWGFDLALVPSLISVLHSSLLE